MEKRGSFRIAELVTVALAVALAWGLRGQHGHERGAAIAGAMAGLSLGAVTGGPRWVGASVIGSLGFAMGGALSYGRFVNLAYHGSWEAIVSLALIGFVWGAFGGLGLGMGLSLSKYKPLERLLVTISMLLIWFTADRIVWVGLSGPDDLETRQRMTMALLGGWALLASYVGFFRRDWAAIRLSFAGAAGFGIGFPLGAWLQGAGSATGIPLDWWKMGEHLMGLCGGLALGWAGLTMESRWMQPLAVRPWERWLALVWLLWLLPAWLIANNLDYWISERVILPVVLERVAWSAQGLLLLSLAVWGWLEMQRGRFFVTSWMPRHVRAIFLVFVWLTTAIACSKTLLAGVWTPTPAVFLSLAFLVTWAVQLNRRVLA